MELHELLEKVKEKGNDCIVGEFTLSTKPVAEVVYCAHQIPGALGYYCMGKALFAELLKYDKFVPLLEGLTFMDKIPETIQRHDSELVSAVKAIDGQYWRIESIFSNIYHITQDSEYDTEIVTDLTHAFCTTANQLFILTKYRDNNEKQFICV